jgi:hypothetical protein
MLQYVGLWTGIHLGFMLEGAPLILFLACSAEIVEQFVSGAVDGTRWTERGPLVPLI